MWVFFWKGRWGGGSLSAKIFFSPWLFKFFISISLDNWKSNWKNKTILRKTKGQKFNITVTWITWFLQLISSITYNLPYLTSKVSGKIIILFMQHLISVTLNYSFDHLYINRNYWGAFPVIYILEDSITSIRYQMS